MLEEKALLHVQNWRPHWDHSSLEDEVFPGKSCREKISDIQVVRTSAECGRTDYHISDHLQHLKILIIWWKKISLWNWNLEPIKMTSYNQLSADMVGGPGIWDETTVVPGKKGGSNDPWTRPDLVTGSHWYPWRLTSSKWDNWWSML